MDLDIVLKEKWWKLTEFSTFKKKFEYDDISIEYKDGKLSFNAMLCMTLYVGTPYDNERKERFSYKDMEKLAILRDHIKGRDEWEIIEYKNSSYYLYWRPKDMEVYRNLKEIRKRFNRWLEFWI